MPDELVNVRCFWERGWNGIYDKVSNQRLTSFKGLQNNVELVAGDGEVKYFSGVLYVGADDGVLRKSEGVPLRECKTISMWDLSHEECDKAFKCETLEELEVYCRLRQIPKDIGKMKKLKKLTLYGLYELKSIPEEIGELSTLEELQIRACAIESLPKRLKELKMLKSISLVSLYKLQLNAQEDLVVFSKLKHLRFSNNVFALSFTVAFWEMIKTTTYLRVLDLDWKKHDEEMVVAALEENRSIVDGGEVSESYVLFFKRNKENHGKALQCVVHLLAIRRWRNALNGVPKEMVRMIAIMLWNTKCDVGAWSKQQ